MRSFAVLLTLGFASSVMAAPSSGPQHHSHQASAVSRRSIPQIANSVLDILSSSASRLTFRASTFMPSSEPQREPEAFFEEFAEDETFYGTYGSYEAEVQAWEARHAQCTEVCKVRKIEGARSGHEALCSADGLESTLACAQCIDMSWPEDLFENSAMAEYTRIALSCNEA